MYAYRGFTLVELMVTVAIVGILAAVAVPAYQGYILTSKLTKTLVVADRIKIYLMEHYELNGVYPTFAVMFADWGLSADQTSGLWFRDQTDPFAAAPEVEWFQYRLTDADSPKFSLSFRMDGLGLGVNDWLAFNCGYEDGAGSLRCYCGSNSTSTNVYEYMPGTCIDTSTSDTQWWEDISP